MAIIAIDSQLLMPFYFAIITYEPFEQHTRPADKKEASHSTTESYQHGVLVYFSIYLCACLALRVETFHLVLKMTIEAPSLIISMVVRRPRSLPLIWAAF